MYDCLAVETRPQSSARPDTQRPDRRWRRRNRLHLALPTGSPTQLLRRAMSAAEDLGFATENLVDGSLVIFDLDLEIALQLARRFPTLLVRFEPACIY